MALVFTTVMPAGAADTSIERDLPASLDELRLPTPLTGDLQGGPGALVGASLGGAEGRVQVVIRLSNAPSSQVAAANQVNQLATVQGQQSSMISSIRGVDGSAMLLGSASRVLNAVIMEIDASNIAAISRLDGVVSMNRVIDHELDLEETVPYIGASAVQDLGYDGTGIEIAVLDSGVDYTHANLGGSGDVADYDANDPEIIEPGTFPTAKVVGGYDFVGPNWVPGLVTEPDPDPLDAGSQAGHGTHVADIIAGVDGVAPGASIHAVKVCSSVSSSCSGIALIQGMDYAVDPNGDGDTSDAVDIINMSLGSTYGQWYDDDLSLAVENASALGVLTVASAGNSADKPYVTGSPAAAPSALSVAQTAVPSAVQPLLQVTAPEGIVGDYAGVFQTWSTQPAGIISAEVIYADNDGDANNLEGCDAFDEDLTGYIVLVDRGSCSFTSKILNVEAAGGIVGIIGLVAPGDPFAGGFGGEGFPVIPGYMVSQADSDLLKSGMPGTMMTIDPDFGIPLVMHMVGSSARGPEVSTNTIKPDIGAPGASVSAIAGTGTDTTAFGGTSGAAPMVSGAAALLMQAYPDRSPAQIKSVLMNTGETNIMNIPEFFGGDLAPIMRIGGGEVRVDAALNASGAAYDRDRYTGSLSFGAVDVHEESKVMNRWVTVENYTGSAVTYDISASFRFQNDADNGAVSLSHPSSITVPAYGSADFKVKMTIDGSALRDWTIGSGFSGSESAGITLFEYDGYVDLTPTSGESLNVAWHVLPRKADAIKARRTVNTSFNPDYGIATGEGLLINGGVGPARIEAFSLLGVSPDLPEGAQGAQAPVTDLRYFGVTTYPEACGPDSFLMRFAINTWEDQSTAQVPNAFIVSIDLDGDGISEYDVYNFPLGFSLGDGRNVTYVDDFVNGVQSAWWFTEHSFNSGNTILSACSQQFGMTSADYFTPMTADVLAYDLYFTGNVTDVIAGVQFSPLGERYVGSVATIDPYSNGVLSVYDFGPAGTNPSESGLLLITTSEDATGISGAKREAIPIRIRPERVRHGHSSSGAG